MRCKTIQRDNTVIRWKSWAFSKLFSPPGSSMAASATENVVHARDRDRSEKSGSCMARLEIGGREIEGEAGPAETQL